MRRHVPYYESSKTIPPSMVFGFSSLLLILHYAQQALHLYFPCVRRSACPSHFSGYIQSISYFSLYQPSFVPDGLPSVATLLDSIITSTNFRHYGRHPSLCEGWSGWLDVITTMMGATRSLCPKYRQSLDCDSL